MDSQVGGCGHLAEPDDARSESGGTEPELDRRESAVEKRESIVERRETAVEVRELAQGERVIAAQEIRAAADRRDLISGARDDAADRREQQLDLAEMMQVDGGYGKHWPERRNAGIDRAHAKGDRKASHADRTAMAENDEGDAVRT